MIKFKYIFGALLMSALVTSCSENLMDKVNQNEDNPPLGIVNGKLQITDSEVSTIYSVLCGNYAWNVASYTEQILGTGNNQLYFVEMRDPSQTAASATFNNEWNGTYSNLLNLKMIIDKCAPGGINDGDNDLLAMAQTLYAYNWGVLTDLHGGIPCSEALADNSAAKIDTQKQVYDRIIVLLDSAIDNATIAINEGQKNVLKQDFIFANDMSQWRGFAHALKARYELRMYGRDHNVLATVIAEANAAIADGFDGAILDIFNGVDADNSWSAFWWSRYYSASSTTVDNLMVERGDPREAIYNFDEWGNDIIQSPGNREQSQTSNVMNAPAWLDNGAAYLHYFSKSELYFILAEAKARLGQDALSDFNTAVAASIDDYNTASTGVVDPISDNDASAFVASLADRFNAIPLKEIMIQKYIAQTRDEQIETYNDMRRCMYSDGLTIDTYYVPMTNPNNEDGARWPVCLPYGESDVVSNPNVAAAYGSGNEGGTYVFTKNVWFAGGSD